MSAGITAKLEAAYRTQHGIEAEVQLIDPVRELFTARSAQISSSAEAHVAARVSGLTVPAEVIAELVERLGGYLADVAPGANVGAAFNNSGCGMLLSPYRRRRARTTT